MDGYEVILAIKMGIQIMQFVVMPLAVFTVGLFTYGIIDYSKNK